MVGRTRQGWAGLVRWVKEWEKPGEGGVVIRKQRKELRGGQGRGVGVGEGSTLPLLALRQGEEGLGGRGNRQDEHRYWG